MKKLVAFTFLSGVFSIVAIGAGSTAPIPPRVDPTAVQAEAPVAVATDSASRAAPAATVASEDPGLLDKDMATVDDNERRKQKLKGREKDGSGATISEEDKKLKEQPGKDKQLGKVVSDRRRKNKNHDLVAHKAHAESQEARANKINRHKGSGPEGGKNGSNESSNGGKGSGGSSH